MYVTAFLSYFKYYLGCVLDCLWKKTEEVCMSIYYVLSFTCRKIDEDTFLPTLMYVLIHGNVTVYEWKHNEPPPNQNQNGTGTALESEKVAEELEIDWGDIDVSTNDQQSSTSPAGIDFGTSGIDFGESEINFDTDVDLSAITIEDSGDVDEAITVAETKAEASGTVALMYNIQ